MRSDRDTESETSNAERVNIRGRRFREYRKLNSQLCLPDHPMTIFELFVTASGQFRVFRCLSTCQGEHNETYKVRHRQELAVRRWFVFNGRSKGKIRCKVTVQRLIWSSLVFPTSRVNLQGQPKRYLLQWGHATSRGHRYCKDF